MLSSLRTNMHVKIIHHQALKAHHTFGVEVFASYFVEVYDKNQALEAIAFAKQKQIPFLILGGGSNVLFTQDYPGLVIKIQFKGIQVLAQTDQDILIQAMAGEVWHDLVMYCVSKGFAGIENLALIPGSCGAAPMQNIGAYGVEVKDILYQVEAIEIDSGKVRSFSLEDCHLGYRESIFKRALKNQFIILSITLKLKKNADFKTSYGAIQEELNKMNISTLSISAISQAVISIRQSKLPNPQELGNAGSFFKNPVISKEHYQTLKEKFEDIPGYLSGDLIKVPAGWLIEHAGWKGRKIGSCGVHTKQALVLVNYGGATGKEILNLSAEIIQEVKTKYDILLEREVNIIQGELAN